MALMYRPLAAWGAIQKQERKKTSNPPRVPSQLETSIDN